MNNPRFSRLISMDLYSEIDSRKPYLFLIATEGEKTEKYFFDNCIERNEGYKLRTIPGQYGLSSPKQVLEKLKSSILEDGADKYNQYWMVIDVDKHENLDSTLEEAERLHIKCAVSNPRFEVWLALYSHESLSDTFLKKLERDSESIVRKWFPHFSKVSLDKTFFQEHEHAINRAVQLDKKTDKKIPTAPGTRMYRLVREILLRKEEGKK